MRMCLRVRIRTRGRVRMPCGCGGACVYACKRRARLLTSVPYPCPLQCPCLYACKKETEGDPLLAGPSRPLAEESHKGTRSIGTDIDAKSMKLEVVRSIFLSFLSLSVFRTSMVKQPLLLWCCCCNETDNCWNCSCYYSYCPTFDAAAATTTRHGDSQSFAYVDH